MKKTEKGVITVYALIGAAVLVTLLGGMLVFVSTQVRNSSDEVSRQKALEIAESGVYFYRWYLAHSLDGKTAQEIKNFWQSGLALGVSSPYEKEVEDANGDPIGKYRIEVTVPDPGSTIVSLVSTGWTYRHPNLTRKVKVRFRRPSWSEYAVVANDVMRFGSGTTIHGPVHSNNGIRFDGVALNKVTSAVNQYLDPDTGTIRPGVWTSQPNENNVFLAGKEFPVPSVDFAGITVDLSLMKTEAQSEGIFLGEETYPKNQCGWVWDGWPPPLFVWSCQLVNAPVRGYHLTLRTDDKLEVRRVFNYNSVSYGITDQSDPEVLDFPANGLVFVENHLWVDGQIDTAKLTLASANINSSEIETNVYINNDILYTNKDGQDIIGIIAENDISVGLYSENNLEIDAALLAQKGRVGRDYYSFFQSSTYYKRDEITVFGSIATNNRYGFAYTDGTGYQIRNLYFDNNLIYYPPPYFPTGNKYQLDLWEDLN